MGKAISPELAKKEIDQWLDLKGVRERKREQLAPFIDALQEGFEDGILVLNKETKKVVHMLQHPIGENGGIKQLEYVHRAKVTDVYSHLKKVKPGDSDGRVIAHIAALSGQPFDVILGMDQGDDFEIAGAYATFFM